jgi:ureidoglycolate lyase/seryl-tRNA synthetase
MTISRHDSIRGRGLKLIDVPRRLLTPESIKGYGELVPDFEKAVVELVPWPLSGRRPLDPGTGLGGGITSGPFRMEWRGDVLYADNHAVGGSYVTGWTTLPEDAREDRATVPRARVLACEANYHPDGSQVFFPRNREPYVALLALPTDEVKPEDFVAFYCDGSVGLKILPNVWHQPLYPLTDTVVFDDKQGAVHGCVSVDFPREFGCLLSVPLSV